MSKNRFFDALDAHNNSSFAGIANELIKAIDAASFGQKPIKDDPAVQLLVVSMYNELFGDAHPNVSNVYNHCLRATWRSTQAARRM